MNGVMLALDPVSYQLPEAMATSAGPIDWLFGVIFWISAAFFVGIVGAMVFFAWKYRKRPGHKSEPTEHYPILELGWTIAPIPILVLLFHWGFQGYIDLSIPPADAIEIRVKGFQWGWDFEYPNGESDNVLHVPKDRNVKLVMSSTDVLHAFYVPGFRTKRDLVPSMYTSVWFRPTKTGETDLMCAEYCGGRSKDANGDELQPSQFKGHWSMWAKVVVNTPEDFEKYMDGLAPDLKGDPAKLAERGKTIWTKKQCAGCHTIDGSKGSAPTWKGLFGKSHKMADGTDVVADENYVRESILTPNAKIVAGYPSPSLMPSFQGTVKDKDIDAIIAFMKAIKD